MNQAPGYKELFGYFRMGLVTGLVSKEALIAWADQEIINQTITPVEIIELSLCGKRPYSEIIWLLSQFEHGSNYQTSINLILAQAALRLEQASQSAKIIILGLRLLIEEEWLTKDLKQQLQTLKNKQKQQPANTDSTLAADLHAFLAPFRQYQADLPLLQEIQ